MASLTDLQALTPVALAPLHVYSTLGNSEADLFPQLAHRIHVVKDIFNIPLGAKVLEIGAGQGDCTIVIAAAVGDEGRVDAIDPGDLNYGRPRTLGEAQAHIIAGPLGPRVNFIQADPAQFLRQKLSTTESIDYTHIVLAHSLWYFDSAGRITELFELLLELRQRRKQGISDTGSRREPKICIASPNLTARTSSQMPHLLATFLRGHMALLNPGAADGSNIRTPVSPGWVRRWFEGHGAKGSEQVVSAAGNADGGDGKSSKGLRDGVWEALEVVREGFLDKIARAADGHREGEVVLLEGLRDAVLETVGGLEDGVEGVECMDVWTFVL